MILCKHTDRDVRRKTVAAQRRAWQQFCNKYLEQISDCGRKRFGHVLLRQQLEQVRPLALQNLLVERHGSAPRPRVIAKLEGVA